MKVLIKHFNAENNTVAFSLEYGRSSAYWEGSIPECNKYYDVEFEIPELLIWNKDIKEEKSTSFNIKGGEDTSYIVGRLESSSEDGCCIVKIGDGVVFLETEGNPFKNGTYISFSSKGLTLCETEL
ncbi:hypothetical protein HOO54_13615 [Bacillus sp. WMMC1349]|uniref:hypothetical protein n=1 Tax=Bacillus sp. WMMC1349 TaxID=2736254 RepID=UPI00155320C8|nr:hypothetical protein [Bacillus sp. WMMC1349]NPC93242.1 hypothetical protein [Bacillus sp. WMMC1349]